LSVLIASAARVRAGRPDAVEGPALGKRIGLGRQIGRHRVDRGVAALVGVFGGCAEFRDDPVGGRANLAVRFAVPVSGSPNLREPRQ
jgi:hypothetical protein